MASRIQRVPPLLRKEEKNKNDYIPKVVSIGPYYHRMPELAPVEEFKPLAVDFFVLGGSRDLDFYYSELLGMIGEIRQCYEENPTVDYSDEELARLMLHDACFIINYMEISAPDTAQPQNNLTRLKIFTMVEHLGLLTLTIVLRDMFLLENQIPLRVIKLLINLRYGQEGVYENLLHRYLNISLFGEYRQKGGVMETEKEEPLHILEAFHRLVISDFKKTGCAGFKCCYPRSNKCLDIESGVGSANSEQGRRILGHLRTLICKSWPAAKNPKNELEEKVIYSFRSVKDLKAKGIHFKPSPTISLKDANFKSHFIYATVQLPYWYVSIYTKVFFLNMIAYELSPKNSTKWEVTSYIHFMKSLLERPEDVKELRDKKILYNKLGSDEEVLSVYKDINTYGADNSEVFRHVKDKIEAHYQSYTKTWMADLIHTYFRTPWTIIAFLAAISLLAISVAQLHYAVHPK